MVRRPRASNLELIACSLRFRQLRDSTSSLFLLQKGTYLGRCNANVPEVLNRLDQTFLRVDLVKTFPPIFTRVGGNLAQRISAVRAGGRLIRDLPGTFRTAGLSHAVIISSLLEGDCNREACGARRPKTRRAAQATHSQRRTRCR